MNNKEAMSILNAIYGMVSPEVQKAIDVANKALANYICGDCTHLIFKDYKHLYGICSITGRDHNFEDKCDHEEEMS